MNQKAVTSLVLGIMSIFIPIAGLILGIFGLTYSNDVLKDKTNDSKDLNVALGGRVCSIVGISLQTTGVSLLVCGFWLFQQFL
ncbi:DUF4190 domain-containing protein [Halobacillus litoralis]|uniref:DUF4190 domain-containing protein n=1 Tax=Halobacillus litoralis TaxID=45668 RepID=UPI001CFE16D8|nr:DUF4190 domain-containing protein [Halobacillus litoralis]